MNCVSFYTLIAVWPLFALCAYGMHRFEMSILRKWQSYTRDEFILFPEWYVTYHLYGALTVFFLLSVLGSGFALFMAAEKYLPIMQESCYRTATTSLFISPGVFVIALYACVTSILLVHYIFVALLTRFPLVSRYVTFREMVKREVRSWWGVRMDVLKQRMQRVTYAELDASDRGASFFILTIAVSLFLIGAPLTYLSFHSYYRIDMDGLTVSEFSFSSKDVYGWEDISRVSVYPQSAYLPRDSRWVVNFFVMVYAGDTAYDLAKNSAIQRPAVVDIIATLDRFRTHGIPIEYTPLSAWQESLLAQGHNADLSYEVHTVLNHVQEYASNQ